jgi:hypothetical protein
MTGACRDAYAALNGSTAGFLLFACLDTCSSLADDVCRNGCKQQFPSAVVPFDNLMACISNNCTTVCGVG